MNELVTQPVTNLLHNTLKDEAGLSVSDHQAAFIVMDTISRPSLESNFRQLPVPFRTISYDFYLKEVSFIRTQAESLWWLIELRCLTPKYWRNIKELLPFIEYVSTATAAWHISVYLEFKHWTNQPTKYNVIPNDVHYTTIPTRYGPRASIFKDS